MYLDIIIIVLIAVHFGLPLLYYSYLKAKWFNSPWNIKLYLNYYPKATIIVPTYNEAENIKRKLNNMYDQEYPMENLEIIVVDSASNDGTVEEVKDWAKAHPEIKLTLLKEPIRKGMVSALNFAIKHVSNDSEIIIFTDVDAFWEKDALKKVIKYFGDNSVGTVSTCILAYEDKYLENSYRKYYNIIRIGESKIHSTPIHNGPLIAFRKEPLEKIGGLPTYTGNDDSTPASLIAFSGYRSIQIDDTTVKELIKKEQVIRKIRRAQHLILHFIYTKRYAKKLNIYKKSKFDYIWKVESFLHIFNPWLLVVITVLSLVSIIFYMSQVANIILISGIILLIFKPYRTWIINQLYLVLATFRNIITKDIIWAK